MKALKKFLLIVIAVLVLLVVLAFFLPAQYRVERSVTINAKAKQIYPIVNTLKKWPSWTAWSVERYPGMTMTFEGPEDGVGATYKWSGDKVGEGMLVINRAESGRGVWYDLDFEGGKYRSQGGITFEEQGDSTRVIWFNGGELGMNPINRYFGLFMDKMMGPDFEEGLRNLKRVVETTK